MKKGDTVIINDGSYTRSIINGKLVHESLAHDSKRGIEYVVIEINCSFPLQETWQTLGYRNNTVIQAIKTGKVVFIHHRFLRPVLPVHNIMIDIEHVVSGFCAAGTVVEISDELYKKIKHGS